MNADSLQGILPFLSAVDAGSFTRAAERLQVTTSAIGKSVSQLERRLGVQLLNRTTRSLNLTSEGEAYYEACAAALGHIEEAQALLASRRQVPSGRLRVDLPLAFGRRCVAPILFEVLRRFPRIEPEVSFSDRRANLVEERLDLVVRMGEPGNEAGLIARRLFVQRFALCASPKYLERHGQPLEVADLSNHTLAVYGRDGTIAPWSIRDESGRRRTWEPRGAIVLGNGEALLDAVLADVGIGYLPSWLYMEAAERGALKLLWPERSVEGAPVHAVWPKTRQLAPKIRVVVDALVGHFSGMGDLPPAVSQ